MTRWLPVMTLGVVLTGAGLWLLAASAVGRALSERASQWCWRAGERTT